MSDEAATAPVLQPLDMLPWHEPARAAPADCVDRRTAAARRAGAWPGRRRQGSVCRRARCHAPVHGSRRGLRGLRPLCGLRTMQGRITSGPALAAPARGQEDGRCGPGPRGLRAARDDQHAAGFSNCDRPAGAGDDDERTERTLEDAGRARAAHAPGPGHVAAVATAGDAAQPLPAAGNRLPGRARRRVPGSSTRAAPRSPVACSTSPAVRRCARSKWRRTTRRWKAQMSDLLEACWRAGSKPAPRPRT